MLLVMNDNQHGTDIIIMLVAFDKKSNTICPICCDGMDIQLCTYYNTTHNLISFMTIQ